MHGVGHRTHGEMDGGALRLQAAKSSVPGGFNLRLPCMILGG